VTADDVRAVGLALEGEVVPINPMARAIAELARTLDGADVPVALRDIGFFRFILANGLLQAQRYEGELRTFVIRALALGVREFAAYLAFVNARFAETTYDGVKDDAKRFYAFCIAQLIEVGFEMDGLLMTLKGDAYDQADAYEFRRLREDGPDAFADSYLFDADEKRLWNAVFDGGAQPAITALQRYYVERYDIPFIPAP